MAEADLMHELIVTGLWRTIVAALILLLTYITARFAGRVMDKSYQRSREFTRASKTRYIFFKRFISATIYVLGIGLAIYVIPELQSLSLSMFAGAGILAIVIGLAAQQTFSNLVSGIFITIFQPFVVGDRIKLSEEVGGIVEDITLMHTILKTFENKRIIIPNSLISNQILENFHFGDGKICKFVEIGISYDSDIDKAMKIMREEAMKHPEFLDNRTPEEKEAGKEAVDVRVIGFGESSVNLRAYVWTPNPAAAFRLGCDLNKSIKERFDKEGITIPFPHRTIVFKNKLPEAGEPT